MALLHLSPKLPRSPEELVSRLGVPMPTAGGRCFALCLTNAKRAVAHILCRYRAKRNAHSRLRPPKPAHQPSGRRVHRQSQSTLKRLRRAHTSYRAMIDSRQRLVASRIQRCDTARDKLQCLNARPWLATLSPHVYHRRRRNLSKRVHKYSLKASLANNPAEEVSHMPQV